MQSAGREGGGKPAASRRPVHFWKPFNDWWRMELERCRIRPTSAQIAKWYDENAKEIWGADVAMHPSLSDTRTHAKCLRSVDAVRKYFRTYRAVKAAPRSKSSAAARRARSEQPKADEGEGDDQDTVSEDQDQFTDQGSSSSMQAPVPVIESAPLRHSFSQGSMSLSTGLLPSSAPLPPLYPTQNSAPPKMWPCRPPDHQLPPLQQQRRRHQQQQQLAPCIDPLPQSSASCCSMQASRQGGLSAEQGPSDGSHLELLHTEPTSVLPAAAAAAAGSSPMAPLPDVDEMLLPMHDDDDALSLDLSDLFQEEEEHQELTVAAPGGAGPVRSVRSCSPPAGSWEQGRAPAPYAPAPLGGVPSRFVYPSGGVQQRSWSYPGGQVGGYAGGRADCSGFVNTEQEQWEMQVVRQQLEDDWAVHMQQMDGRAVYMPRHQHQHQQRLVQAEEAAYLQWLRPLPPPQRLPFLPHGQPMMTSRSASPVAPADWQPAPHAPAAQPRAPVTLPPVMWPAVGQEPRQGASAMEPGMGHRQGPARLMQYGQPPPAAACCPYPFN